MPEGMPDDPFTKLAAGATSMHEMYLSFVAAGFKEEHAIALLQTILATTTAVAMQQRPTE